MKYYDYDYNNHQYYKVPYPAHDHYIYDPATDAWYEKKLQSLINYICERDDKNEN